MQYSCYENTIFVVHYFALIPRAKSLLIKLSNSANICLCFTFTTFFSPQISLFVVIPQYAKFILNKFRSDLPTKKLTWNVKVVSHKTDHSMRFVYLSSIKTVFLFKKRKLNKNIGHFCRRKKG